MALAITLSSIGAVCSPVTERTDMDWGDVAARVELRAEYAGALTGLDGFSHALVVTYLHQAHFDAGEHLMRRPRGRDDLPQVGILSQRAKNRPNPIGITAVEILKVGETSLEVRGLDAIDGTPVLDIKPYFPAYDRVEKPRVPSWVEELMEGYF